MRQQELGRAIVEWRKDFHRHPELGFLEYRTASRICEELSRLPNCQLRIGSEVMVADSRFNPPSAQDCAAAKVEAIAHGASPAWVERFGDGLTGVVGEWKFQRRGPVLAFRFDIDALPVQEPAHAAHRPVAEGFASRFPGRMHACGHDAHAAMGLGLASVIAGDSQGLCGTLRLIFQPAEEGCRGAKSIVSAGILSDVDWLICGHIGVSAKRLGQVSCGAQGLLATTKFEVRFTGVPSHAGLEPHLGRNALLAGATAALQLHALPRHPSGDTRVNVGVLQSGTAANIVPGQAFMKFEVRGATTEVNRFMAESAERVIQSAAALYGVSAEIKVVAEAASANCDSGIIEVVREAAWATPGVSDVIDQLPTSGSEDATLMMEAVQARGGQATYVMIGSAMPAGHHHDAFDLEDAAMELGVEIYRNIIRRLLR